jgi:exopolysaccharide biosynthesis polyprenyl glycosylphosphotransferase
MDQQAKRMDVASDRAKRVMDVVITLPLLLLLLPLIAAVALLIKLDDGGPVLFRQTRIGRGGRPFPFLKFRSMRVGAEVLQEALRPESDHGPGVTFKMRRDPRVTRIGLFLRRSSLDELPQLWCVLCGTMSLVGPRPPLPKEAARYTPAERRRLDVKPGLTCLWQTSGRSDLPFPEQLRLDVQYIETRSLWLDLKILVKTIPAVLSGRGAY